MAVRIERINFIRGFGSFCSWECGADVPNFARYNLIYGWNGSGKTTLSRLLRSHETGSLSDRSDIGACEWELVLSDGRKVGAGDLDTVDLPVRVFNEDFVRENLRFDAASTAPFLVLGKGEIDIADRLRELGESLKSCKLKLASDEEERDTARRDLDRQLEIHAKHIKETVSKDPSDRYRNYDKRNMTEALEQIRDSPNRPKIDVEVERKRLSSVPLSTVSVSTEWNPDGLQLLWRQVGAVLQFAVEDTAIADLRSDPDVQTWVGRGLELHAGRDKECLFCTQPVPGGRIADLRHHFSVDYSNHLAELERVGKVLRAISQALARFIDDIGRIEPTRFYPEFQKRWTDVREGATAISGDLALLLREQEGALQAKIQDPFVPIDNPVSVERIKTAVELAETWTANVFGVVSDHDAQSKNLSDTRAKAQTQISLDAAWEIRETYLELVKTIDLLDKSIEAGEEERKKTDETRSALEADASGYRPACDLLNAAFHQYFGHTQFEVRPSIGSSSGAALELLRDGDIATNLSAGERTGIALIYFLARLQEEGVELSDTIVIVDDPVSSLDENSLYQAFGFILDRTVGAAQVFVLTHSFQLFRLIRQRFKKSPEHEWADSQEFMIARETGDGAANSSLLDIDSALKNHDSEYHYLFVTLYRYADDRPEALVDAYLIPNIARRVLETFLAFKKPIKGSLEKRVRQFDFDEAKVQRIIRFVDHHSHGDGTSRIEDIGALGGDEARSVARDVLDFMRSVDRSHVQDMQTHVERD